jgi:hypothetical protein
VLELVHEKGLKVEPGSTLVVTRPGGTITLEGRTVRSTEPDFPPFELGDEYILFLERLRDGSLGVYYGAQGAFKVSAETVEQVSRFNADWKQKHGVVGLSAFRRELATILVK